MNVVPLYELEPYRTEVETCVVASGTDENGPWAALRDQLFYPEGGGQPADHGWLGDVPVVGSRRLADGVRVTTAAVVAEGPVTAALDWRRRFDHMQQHTAQHLVTALASDLFGWPTTAFHLGAEVSDVELDVPRIERPRLDELEEAVAERVRAALPVTARRVAPDALAGLPVRTRGLPEGHRGEVRLVEIDGVDLNTCGGTHVRSTAELEAVKLLCTEPLRGGTRVHFVAGGRLRRRLAILEERSAQLRRELGAADADLVAVAALRGEQVRALERALKRSDDELAGLWAESLAARPGALAEARFEGRDMAFLLRTARGALAVAPAKVLLLTGRSADGVVFAIGAGDAAPVDVAALGRDVAAALGGRGGGSGRIFQGKAPAGAAHERAVAALAARLGTPVGR